MFSINFTTIPGRTGRSLFRSPVLRTFWLALATASIGWHSVLSVDAAEVLTRPNIVYILADDLGPGDVAAFNRQSKIATPNMDKLASQGMRFTDAHSGSAVCTPTRYGVLTGRYAWRTRLQKGVCWGYSPPLIAKDRLTVASLVQRFGYRTACVGKWHLGLKWGLEDEQNPPLGNQDETWEKIDFTQAISSGPNEIGFDYFFGIPASLDMHPHVYIKNHRVTMVPTEILPGSVGKKYWRSGPVGDDFKHVEVLDKLTEKAVEFIQAQTADKPFLLYFPLTAPHNPIIPQQRFQNQSGLNEWGDFVMQVDWTVGEVMNALQQSGLAKNTLFIVTSDNGATPSADFPFLVEHGHNPSHVYRGHKADLFEGGHRVPFIARWPKVIEVGSSCSDTICHTDLLATVADITDFTLPAAAGEDSVSMMPLFEQTATNPIRDATVHHSIDGSFAIRRGNWKLLLCSGSGGWSEPRAAKARKAKLPTIQLYDLASDIAESTNVASEHPDVVEQLISLLKRYVDQGRSTPGRPQANDVKVQIGAS